MKYKTVRTDKLTAVVNATTFIVMFTFYILYSNLLTSVLSKKYILNITCVLHGIIRVESKMYMSLLTTVQIFFQNKVP